ncbi:hypothetical protein [Altericista sp. CCNU0014]|uniref:hypothetical protein n=1 Tax=Altericista sp. CCNU0014 TaxID=3082949 RepID=UPI0038514A02
MRFSLGQHQGAKACLSKMAIAISTPSLSRRDRPSKTLILDAIAVPSSTPQSDRRHKSRRSP